MEQFPLRVLYVEDKRVVRENITNVLENMVKEVIVAENGDDGLQKYKLYHNNPVPIDLVITDITMPIMNGFEMVEKIREIEKDVHVIILSGLEFGDYIKDMNRISILNQYIQKPLNFLSLLEIIKKVQKDINERIEYKKQYSLSLQYQNALDNSAIVTKTDKSGVITYVNDAFCEISGYKREELIGKSHNIVRDPSVPKEFFKHMWSVIQAKLIYKHSSIPNKMKNGDIYYVNTTILPILDENRNIQEYLSIRFDTTELERQIRADKKALQSQERFLANMSHEIRTPLNGILGFAKILEEQITDPELKDYANTINYSGKNLLTLLNQILDFSKVQNGHLELDAVWLNLYDDIKAIKRLFEISAKEKGVELQCSLCNTLSDNLLRKEELFTDGLKLRQVISNLLSNAIKFTPKGGRIDFEIKRVAFNNKTVTLRFSVKDIGIGIAKEKQKFIFEPFKQADLSTTREYGGTGLGLALSKDFVKLFDSELKVESAIGEGSEFYFEAEFQYRNLQSSCEEKRESFILLAEDVQINQKLTEIILKDIDAKIIFAENGLEAVEIFKKEWDKIDAVLLDINMPVMNGIEACKRINQLKQNHNILNIPIIALTSDSSLKEKEQYITLGFDLYISKPINEEILKSTLKKISKKSINNFDDIDQEKEMIPLDGLQLPQEIKSEAMKDFHHTTSSSITTNQNGVLKGTILVAEDVFINQKLIEIILKKFGLEVVFANNGLEAVEYFIKNYQSVDAILLDINMPVMDGMEACSRIAVFKKLNSIANIPLIALTANAISGDKERYLRIGFDEYLPKPIDNEKLFEILNKYLQGENNVQVFEDIKLKESLTVEIDFEENAKKLSLPLEFYQELLEDFCKLLEKEIPKLSEAIEGKDAVNIKEIAHKLKGVAGNLALDSLFDRFKSIEENLQEQQYEKINILLSSIKNIFKKFPCIQK